MAKSTTRDYKPLTHGTLTVDNTAGGVGVASVASAAPTNSQISQSTLCEMGPLEGAQIRYTIDGTAPTTSVGHLLEIGERLVLESHEEIQKFKAIRTGSTSGTLPTTLFR